MSSCCVYIEVYVIGVTRLIRPFNCLLFCMGQRPASAPSLRYLSKVISSVFISKGPASYIFRILICCVVTVYVIGVTRLIRDLQGYIWANHHEIWCCVGQRPDPGPSLRSTSKVMASDFISNAPASCNFRMLIRCVEFGVRNWSDSPHTSSPQVYKGVNHDVWCRMGKRPARGPSLRSMSKVMASVFILNGPVSCILNVILLCIHRGVCYWSNSPHTALQLPFVLYGPKAS